MDRSPQGREIAWIEGSPDAISRRGAQIVSLGNQMVDSAAILKSIADGASGMKGLSIDKIREVTGDVHEELKLAGERYSPTGAILQDYAGALREVQSGLQAIIDDCGTYWDRYENRLDDYQTADRAANQPLFVIDPDAPDPQDKVDDAESSMNLAHDHWVGEAELYDAKYDSWETAFDDATSRIGTATEGGISDSWTDDFNDWVDQALQVLSVVGLVLGVLCLIVGGPLLAALAAIVAIAALIGTIYLMTQGRRNGEDLAWAIVGVIPFGKLGSLFKGSEGVAKFFKGFVGIGDGNFGPAIGQLKNGFSAFRTGFVGASPGLPRLLNGVKSWGGTVLGQMGGGSDILARYFGAQNAKNLAELMDAGDVAPIILGHASKVKTVIKSWIMGGIAPLFQTDPVDKWRTELAS